MEQKYAVLDYYEGAYGPTVRMDIHSIDILRELKNLFLWLSKSSERRVDLTELTYISAMGFDVLVLQSASDKTPGKRFKRLAETTSGSSGLAFSWIMSPDDWSIAAGLVHRLIEDNEAGHQYLTQEGINDAIVELAYME